MIVAIADGHLTGILARLAATAAIVVRTGEMVPAAAAVLLGKDLHLQLGATLSVLRLAAAAVDHHPEAAAVFAIKLGAVVVCGADRAGRLRVRLPVGGGLLLEVGEPLEAVRLGEKIDEELALPVLQVGEGEGLDHVGDLGQQASQVFVVVQVQDPWKKIINNTEIS